MRIGRSLILFVALFCVPILVCIAQGSGEESHAPDGGSRLTISNISIPPIPNAPFTAIVKAEVIRHLEDGTTLTNKNHRTVARDSSGRIFQERRLLTEDGDIRETRLTQLEFSDPTTHQLYICDPTGLSCTLHPYFESASVQHVQSRQSDQGGLQSVNLGSAIINGIDTVGTRETTVINPNGAGDNRTISVTKEFWYASQLGINMITKRFDPRFGTQIFQVTDVILGEPNPRLFELPPGAKILEEKPLMPSR